MTGRGWLVIYGLLLMLVVFLFISQLSVNSDLDRLNKQVAALQTALQEQPTPQAAASLEPSPTASPSPDLSTPAARDAKRKADLAQIQTALAAYFKDKKTYPTELKELTPQFIAVLPTDPLSPKYTYRYKKTTSGFELTCYIESSNDPDDPKDGKKDNAYLVTQKTPLPSLSPSPAS